MYEVTTLQRFQGLRDANADALGTVNKATSRVALDHAVTALAQAAAKQGEAQTAATSRTKLKDASREDLRTQHMRPIAAIAKKKRSTTPLIVDMRLPVRRTRDAGLIAAATTRTRPGSTRRLSSISNYRRTSSRSCRRACWPCNRAVVTRDVVLTQVKAATQTTVDQPAIASTDVHVLNALVVKQLKGKTDLLAAWKQAKRVKAKLGVPTGTRKAPAIPPAPTPPVTTPPALVPVAAPPAVVQEVKAA